MLIGAPLSRPLAAAGMVAFFLGLIEAAQLFLPGRVAESTDPVLALILGLVIRLLSVRGKPA
jgi:VanZ family protein